jgi:two-component system phosphate regulon sensor histidine kinase PhoR
LLLKNGSTRLYVDVIAEENKHMERNVEQILQLAVLEADTERKYFHRTNINALIEEAIKSFSIQLQHTGGVIKTDFNAENPYLYCNGQQMRNMLQNLLDNAIKYRSPQPPVISISTFDTGSHFVVQVEDNGIGMSVETQQHIFDRFFRGNTGDRHDVKGFGLGMSYVKYIVGAHEGEINIKSKQGKGTRITIYLPKTLETVS